MLQDAKHLISQWVLCCEVAITPVGTLEFKIATSIRQVDVPAGFMHHFILNPEQLPISESNISTV